MAKGRLTELEQVYIKYNSDKMTVAEIAKKLGRTVKTVDRELDKHRPLLPVEHIIEDLPTPPQKLSKTTDEPVYQPSQVEGLFGRREGITMMTPNASQACDEVRDHTRSNVGKFKNSMTTIKKKT